MDVTVQIQRALLEYAWNNATPASNSLHDQLIQESLNVLGLFRAGSLGSVNSPGGGHSYQGPGTGRLTQEQISRTYIDLADLFDVIKSEIDAEIAASDSQQPPDDYDPEVIARMRLLLRPVDEYASDLTDLLLPPTIAPPVPMTQ